MPLINTDFLHKELLRVSEWVRFADQKAAFVSVFYTAILGYLVTNEALIYTALTSTNSSHWLFFLVIFLSLCFSLRTGLTELYCSVFPTLKNIHSGHSFFYFGTIAKKDINDYITLVKTLTEEDGVQGLAEQIHTNSVIADRKMNSVSQSIKALIVSTALVFLLMLFINHLK